MKQEGKRLVVRADENLINAFHAAATSNDRTSSQLIRDFMREYVKKHGQVDMFGKSH
jgi:metal-responsive CopG/Arc/MetJ family transcriptional regulator